jgi:hydroxyacylglutathione hydrolase
MERKEAEPLVVEHFPVGPLGCTCTIVADPASGEAIVVDGGDEAERIAARLAALGVRATALVHTHAHIDHIGALGALRERTGAPGLLHPADLPLYATMREQARWLGVAPPPVVALDGELRDGDRVGVGAATLDVLHTPGHTPGSVSFALALGGRTMLLTGDTLFRGSVGRWDLGGTSLEDIVASIRAKLLAFGDDTVVVPGHGPATTIGIERTSNPFLVA